MCVTLSWPRDVIPATAVAVLSAVEQYVALALPGAAELTSGWLCAVLCQRGVDFYAFTQKVSFPSLTDMQIVAGGPIWLEYRGREGGPGRAVGSFDAWRDYCRRELLLPAVCVYNI